MPVNNTTIHSHTRFAPLSSNETHWRTFISFSLLATHFALFCGLLKVYALVFPYMKVLTPELWNNKSLLNSSKVETVELISETGNILKILSLCWKFSKILFFVG